MCLQFADRGPIDMHAWFRFLLILPGRLINSLNITQFHLTHLCSHSFGLFLAGPASLTKEILAKPSLLCRYHYLPCVLRLLDWLAKINKKHKDPRKNVTAMMWASSFSLKIVQICTLYMLEVIASLICHFQSQRKSPGVLHRAQHFI